MHNKTPKKKKKTLGGLFFALNDPGGPDRVYSFFHVSGFKAGFGCQ
jgi:hypothetical protein